jgi:hypothetical protein
VAVAGRSAEPVVAAAAGRPRVRVEAAARSKELAVAAVAGLALAAGGLERRADARSAGPPVAWPAAGLSSRAAGSALRRAAASAVPWVLAVPGERADAPAWVHAVAVAAERSAWAERSARIVAAAEPLLLAEPRGAPAVWAPGVPPVSELAPALPWAAASCWHQEPGPEPAPRQSCRPLRQCLPMALPRSSRGRCCRAGELRRCNG